MSSLTLSAARSLGGIDRPADRLAATPHQRAGECASRSVPFMPDPRRRLPASTVPCPHPAAQPWPSVPGLEADAP
jgi:hypothetical protein